MAQRIEEDCLPTTGEREHFFFPHMISRPPRSAPPSKAIFASEVQSVPFFRQFGPNLNSSGQGERESTFFPHI